MILTRKTYHKALKDNVSVKKIQQAWRRYFKAKLIKFEAKRMEALQKALEKQNINRNELNIQKNDSNKQKNEPKTQKNDLNTQKNDLNTQKNDPNTQKNGLYTQKKDVLIEKIQRQKESIRKLHEPGFKSLAKPRSRLNKIQSNKDFLEENKQNAATMLTKKSSYPIISNEPEDFFTNNLENTKKINNMIANANQLLASNLTKIYGDRKKVNRNKEESFNNDLFNFFHKNKK